MNLNQICKNRKSIFREGRRYSGDWWTRTPSKLFVAEAMLRTSDANQQLLTIFEEVVPSADWYENCRVVAVMLEKKMATVAKSMNEFLKWSCFFISFSRPGIRNKMLCVSEM